MQSNTNGELSRKHHIVRKIVVRSSDLPVSCPMPEMELWNMHPKVYLPLAEKKICKCPYCGTEYHLEKE